jgi:hypothetical protein
LGIAILKEFGLGRSDLSLLRIECIVFAVKPFTTKTQRHKGFLVSWWWIQKRRFSSLTIIVFTAPDGWATRLLGWGIAPLNQIDLALISIRSYLFAQQSKCILETRSVRTWRYAMEMSI